LEQGIATVWHLEALALVLKKTLLAPKDVCDELDCWTAQCNQQSPITSQTAAMHSRVKQLQDSFYRLPQQQTQLNPARYLIKFHERGLHHSPHKAFQVSASTKSPSGNSATRPTFLP